MELKRRLARLEPTRGRTRVAGAEAGRVDPPRPRTAPPSLGFRETDGPGGRIWIREREIRNAAWPELPDFEGLDLLFTRRAPDLPGCGDILLLDAETTGLAGGTGTLAFLIGTVFQGPGGALILRQYFLPSPGAEPAMLADLSRLASGFRMIMTYNGNAFDLPLLRTRGILSRIRDILNDPVSWDLLPAARRLWGRRLENCRQQTVEQALSGAPRGEGDIDGHLIPQVWLDFVRTGRVRGLKRIVTHNDRDMVGMVEIFGAVVARMDLYRAGPGRGAGIPWQDAWCLALLAEKSRDARLQAAWIRSAIAARRDAGIGPVDADVDERFWKDALRLVKRGKTDAVTADVLAAARDSIGDRLWLDREAAIFHEHRLCDPAGALRFARRLDETRRIERLERRLGRPGR